MAEIKASPQNQMLGLLSQGLTSGRSFLNQAQVPVFGGLGDLLLGQSPELVEDVSYYGPKTLVRGGNTATGGLGTYTLDPRIIDAAGAAGLAPGSSRVAMAAVNPATYGRAFMQAQAPAVMSNVVPKSTNIIDVWSKKLGMDLTSPIQRQQYVGTHSAPIRSDASAPLTDLARIYPDDIYSPKAAQYYGSYRPDDALVLNLAKMARNNPQKEVTIYRAVPKDAGSADIFPGDWVTPSKQYAKEHGEGPLGGEYKIISKKVPAGSLYTDGNMLQEFGYDPFGFVDEVMGK